MTAALGMTLKERSCEDSLCCWYFSSASLAFGRGRKATLGRGGRRGPARRRGHPKEVMERARAKRRPRPWSRPGALPQIPHPGGQQPTLRRIDLRCCAGQDRPLEILRPVAPGEPESLSGAHPASISPVYPEKGEGLSVRLSLSKNRLKEGEEVRIFYQTNRTPMSPLLHRCRRW